MENLAPLTAISESRRISQPPPYAKPLTAESGLDKFNMAYIAANKFSKKVRILVDCLSCTLNHQPH